MEQELLNWKQEIEKTMASIGISITLKDLKGHTIIFIVDMINGFCNEGNLTSKNHQAIIPNIVKLINKANEIKINRIIAMNDSHSNVSPEFKSYQPHCLTGTKESELVRELDLPFVKKIKKNSTNGFFAFDFKPNLYWDNIIIVGCCTDICVSQLALSCKTWFNQHDKEVNVFVPMTMTATFDGPGHPSKLINEIAWTQMIRNGIKVVKDIV